LVRPLFSQFFPELARFIQPLSGEYAGRRALLEQLSFSVGYGVELGHLIDILEMDGIDALAQVDLDMRIHRNQTTEALGRMSFGILHTFFERVQKYGKSKLVSELGEHHISLERSDAEHRVVKTEISTVERPPMITVPEYRTRFKK
jgi:glucosyl-3-phosphoglycerate synthase